MLMLVTLSTLLSFGVGVIILLANIVNNKRPDRLGRVLDHSVIFAAS